MLILYVLLYFIILYYKFNKSHKSYKLDFLCDCVADIQKLRELGELRDSGILTQEEFDKEKHKILNNDFSSPSPSTPSSIIGENVFNPDGTSADSASQKELGLNSPGFFSKFDTC